MIIQDGFRMNDSLNEKNQKALTQCQRYAKDHCISSFEEHKKFLLLCEKHAQTYGNNRTFFLFRKEIEQTLQKREHMLATKAQQKRRMDIVIQ